MGRLFVLIALIVVLVLLLHWFLRTPPARVARTIKRVGIGLLVGVLVLLAATGRLHWLFALVAMLIPLAQRVLTLLRLAPFLQRLFGLAGLGAGAGQAAGPRTSTITTRFLRMALDHESGHMHGTVLAGRFQGKSLEQMPLPDLLALLAECRAADPQSAAVLEAYLDRVQGPDWRQANGGDREQSARNAAAGPMSRDDAYAILGLNPGASADDIRDAHRRLMQKLHPDRGGSDYLAAMINRAKDLLLA